MAQEKIIRSHGARVKEAQRLIKMRGERISVFDREAFVEFLLLEDIERLYEARLAREKERIPTTRAGEMAQKRNIAKFNAVLNLFRSAADVARALIDDGHYAEVWRSIPEYPLTKAAGSTKNLRVLREMATKLLRDLYQEAVDALEEQEMLDEELDAIESHDANLRNLRGLPSAESIEALIRDVTEVIPDAETAKAGKSKAKPVIS